MEEFKINLSGWLPGRVRCARLCCRFVSWIVCYVCLVRIIISFSSELCFDYSVSHYCSLAWTIFAVCKKLSTLCVSVQLFRAWLDYSIFSLFNWTLNWTVDKSAIGLLRAFSPVTSLPHSAPRMGELPLSLSVALFVYCLLSGCVASYLVSCFGEVTFRSG